MTALDKLGLNVTRNKNINFDNLKQNLMGNLNTKSVNLIKLLVDLLKTENDKFIPFNMIKYVLLVHLLN